MHSTELQNFAGTPAYDAWLAERDAIQYRAWLDLRPQRGWPLLAQLRSRLIRSRLARVWRFLRRVFRALRKLATDKRLPWWVRIMLVIGCIQIPVLPIDEIFLAASLTIIAIWYRAPLRDALATIRRDHP